LDCGLYCDPGPYGFHAQIVGAAAEIAVVQQTDLIVAGLAEIVLKVEREPAWARGRIAAIHSARTGRTAVYHAREWMRDRVERLSIFANRESVARKIPRPRHGWIRHAERVRQFDANPHRAIDMRDSIE
jgi:hypothetical protein